VNYSINELLISAMAKEIRNDEVTSVGTLSPIPAAACLLAKRLYAPEAVIRFIGLRGKLGDTFEETFNLAQRGEIGLFFLSGAQVDEWGNINLTVIGDFIRPRVRLPGGAGSAMLYYEARRVVLFLLEHSRRRLVPKVDFLTSPGYTPDLSTRRGGPSRLFTPMAVFRFDSALHRFVIESLHPGVSPAQVVANTGFSVEIGDDAEKTFPPTEEELAIIRSEVKEELIQIYPDFASRL